MDEIKEITPINDFVKLDSNNIEKTISVKVTYNKEDLNKELGELIEIVSKYKYRIKEIQELLTKF
jgi:hypothetical protein